MGISGEFCAEDTACAKALSGEEAWGTFRLEESSQAGRVGGGTVLGGKLGRWAADLTGPSEPQPEGFLCPGGIRMVSRLQVWAVAPSCLGLNLFSAFCQLGDLGQVAEALCASVSSL